MLTTGSIKSLYSRLQNAQGRIAAVREKSEEMIGHTLQAAEVSGTAFGMAYANARYGNGELKVMGLSADLAAGIVLHGVALVGKNKYNEHIHNVADGLLASFAVRQGAAMGAKAASTGFQPAAAFAGFQPAAAFAGFQPAAAYAGFQPAAAYRR